MIVSGTATITLRRDPDTLVDGFLRVTLAVYLPGAGTPLEESVLVRSGFEKEAVDAANRGDFTRLLECGRPWPWAEDIIPYRTDEHGDTHLNTEQVHMRVVIRHVEVCEEA